MSTDTPRTHEVLMQCPEHLPETAFANTCMDLEQELKASQAEVERLDKAYRETSRQLHLHEMGMHHKPKMQATIDTLRSQLARAVEIAETSCKYLDTGGWHENEMYSGKDGWVTETEIDEVCAKLTALKGGIK